MRRKQGSVYAIGQGSAQFFHPLQPIWAKFTNPEEYKKAIMMVTFEVWEVAASSQKDREVINFYICSVTGIDGEFKIDMKNFMVTS